jgi:hypothetical protein
MEVIKIKDYDSYYNPKDGMYYVDKSFPHKKSRKDHHKKEKCCGGNNNEINININTANDQDNNTGNVRPSAFAATANREQPLTNVAGKVNIFGREEFDLNNEYDPATSTFIPRQSGIYSITAGVEFEPNDINTSYRGVIIIRVNGVNTLVDGDNMIGSSTVDVSGLIELQAGDRVEVFALMTIPGVAGASTGSRFQGSRVSGK